eukprot:scpid48898/ scgid23075/ 
MTAPGTAYSRGSSPLNELAVIMQLGDVCDVGRQLVLFLCNASRQSLGVHRHTCLCDMAEHLQNCCDHRHMHTYWLGVSLPFSLCWSTVKEAISLLTGVLGPVCRGRIIPLLARSVQTVLSNF